VAMAADLHQQQYRVVHMRIDYNVVHLLKQQQDSQGPACSTSTRTCKKISVNLGPPAKASHDNNGYNTLIINVRTSVLRSYMHDSTSAVVQAKNTTRRAKYLGRAELFSTCSVQ
jgi:hypothetical protein